MVLFTFFLLFSDTEKTKYIYLHDFLFFYLFYCIIKSNNDNALLFRSVQVYNSTTFVFRRSGYCSEVYKCTIVQPPYSDGRRTIVPKCTSVQ